MFELLQPDIEIGITYKLGLVYPHGPNAGNGIGPAFDLVTTVIKVIAAALEKNNSNIKVDLETEIAKSGRSVVKGLVIHHDGLTSVVPLSLSPEIVRIRKRPIYLLHANGAADCFEALLNEIESEIESKMEVRGETRH